MDQLPLSNRSFTLSETCGTDQSSSTAGQEASLEQGEDKDALVLKIMRFTYECLPSFLFETHRLFPPSMQRVPNPGFSVRAPSSLLM